MLGQRKKISVVCPAFNEEEVLARFHAEVSQVFEELGQEHELELLVVDDGSRDRTLLVLRELADLDPRVHYVSLSRNFGHQAAGAAGLQYATGDVVINMDADLQHPPALIPQMLELWRGGYDLVLTSRDEKSGFGIKPFARKVFFWLMNHWSKGKLNANYSDFRLLSRRVVDSLLQFPERHQFIRGLVAYVGFPTAVLAFKPVDRLAGVSKFSFLKLLSYGMDALFSFSRGPLQITYFLSFVLLAFTLVLWTLPWILSENLGALLPGQMLLGGLVCLCGAFILCSQGISNEYLVRIFEQVQGRPLFFIKESRLPGECRQEKLALYESREIGSP
ncbi:MAG: glycosyltransferase [Gemmataceae bacterium]|nr:glycosyltransferase [Gemmataceae bacterium]